MGLETERKPRKRYVYFKAKEVEHIKKLLEEKRDKILLKKKNSDQSEFCLQKEELLDEIDAANANTQLAQELRFKTRDNYHLRKIESQLRNTDDAYFGECEECGECIGLERLKARPEAKMCISCQEKAEADKKMNAIQGRSKSFGRTIQEVGRP